MKRPLAYITAAWLGGDSENAELAAQYCRTVYEAGFSPICPPLYLPLFLNDAVPEAHKVFSFPKLSIREQMAAYQEIIDGSSLEGYRQMQKKDRGDR